MADWVLRPAEDSDVEAIAELRAVTMRPSLESVGRYDEHRVRQRLRDGFAAQHTSVIEVEGAGDKSVAKVDFRDQGVKRLLLRYAPVEKL